MYLKRIEVSGFKSFADKMKLDFGLGITAVVGPNGSGKSNISDAVRWVLGEQSAKSLRSSNMQEVIFAGTQNRKPMGAASVSLFIDNEEGKIPLDISEVKITRRVYRSGESEYQINNTSCRLKDIHELFMDTGVGKEGYSIIGQGKIDEIISSKPKDRRHLFDEATGITKYKSRKNEAEKKLSDETTNLTRVEDIITELEKQVGPLKVQSEKAKKYVEYKKELKDYEVNLFLNSLEKYASDKEKYETEEQRILDKIQNNEEETQKLKDKVLKLSEENESIDIKIREEREENSKAITEFESKKSEISILEEKNSHIDIDVLRLKKEIEEYDSNINSNENKLVEIKKQIDELSSEINIKELELEEKEKTFIDIDEALNNKEIAVESMKGDIIDKLNLISKIKTDMERTKVQKETAVERLKNYEEEMNSYEDRLQDNKKIYEKCQEESILLKDKYDKLVNDNSNLKNKIKEENEKIINNKEDINKNLKEKHGMLSKLNLLKDMKNNHEGFNYSVKNILKAELVKKFNLEGTVADVITVKKEYETAIEIALGAAMQNVIVKDEQNAKSAIEHLKQNKLGRATFLPLNIIKGRKAEVQVKTEGFKGIASELISFDERYRNILENALGRIIICTDMNSGIKIAKELGNKYRIVTLEGDVINPGGSMTGGASNKKRTNIFGRDREIKELEKNILEVTAKVESLEKETIAMEKVKVSNIKLAEDRELDIEELKISIIEKKNELNNYGNTISELEEREDFYKFEIKQLNMQISTFDESSKKHEVELLKSEDEIELIKEGVSNHQLDTSEQKIEKDRLIEKLTNLKVLISERREYFKSVESEYNRISEEVKYTNRKKQENEVTIKSFGQSTEENIELIKMLKNELVELDKKLVDFKAFILEAEESKKELVDSIHEANTSLEGKVADLIKINEDKIKIRAKLEKIEENIETTYDKMWEEYEMTITEARELKSDLGSESEIKDIVTKLKGKIRTLGNVNLDSIEEYEKVSERYEFLKVQRDDIVEAEKKLRKVIKELDDSMQEQFETNLKVIKENFKSTFKDLFGGGKAEIVLENEDDVLNSGVDIVAQPPGKKLQNMMLLSGGEKALTAISLLFAILKMKPSPFCILDEIEAALDDANVDRYASYLNEFSEKTQFITITHRKGTMEAANALYGVTMEEQGVSKMISVNFEEIDKHIG
ncbi:MAG: chromosome segregation protein SMC [Clostridia bacterium]|nr:chromosome segregation protein SMC [Clostridia bacterium]